MTPGRLQKLPKTSPNWQAGKKREIKRLQNERVLSGNWRKKNICLEQSYISFEDLSDFLSVTSTIDWYLCCKGDQPLVRGSNVTREELCGPQTSFEWREVWHEANTTKFFTCLHANYYFIRTSMISELQHFLFDFYSTNSTKRRISEGGLATCETWH